MIERTTDYGLEFLLAFDGRIHHLEDGCWIKFEIKRVRPTRRRPHGLSYSFTLHAPDGTRLVGFDNAHKVRPRGSRLKRAAASADHWHRTTGDRGRPTRSKTPTPCCGTSSSRFAACWPPAAAPRPSSEWKRQRTRSHEAAQGAEAQRARAGDASGRPR